MNLPDLAVINFSSVSDPTVQRAVRAVNRQVREDFMPVWGAGYCSRLHMPRFDPGDAAVLSEDPVTAAAVIYLVDQPHLQNALMYHSINSAGLPVGFVFTDLGDWTVTLSHELLELIVDPTVNGFVPGPDPRAASAGESWLWHAYEVCDAVESTVYEIDDIMVSNFVTPAYFAQGQAAGARNDFLGIGVAPFGVLPGCHLGAVDPQTLEWLNIQGDDNAACGALKSRMKRFAKPGGRPRPGEREQQMLERCIAAAAAEHPARTAHLSGLAALTRSGRKQRVMRCNRP